MNSQAASGPTDAAPYRRPRYRLYIDESGDHTYNQIDTLAHRYLSLLGVWFQLGDEYNEFATELERFKLDFFGQRPDNPVVLHRSEIINRKGAFGILCDEVNRDRFDAELLGVVSRARFKMILCSVGQTRTHEAVRRSISSLSLLSGYHAGAIQRLAELQEHYR